MRFHHNRPSLGALFSHPIASAASVMATKGPLVEAQPTAAGSGIHSHQPGKVHDRPVTLPLSQYTYIMYIVLYIFLYGLCVLFLNNSTFSDPCRLLVTCSCTFFEDERISAASESLWTHRMQTCCFHAGSLPWSGLDAKTQEEKYRSSDRVPLTF